MHRLVARVLDVTHFFHSLRFIEKYVIVVVSVCFSLMSLNLSLALHKVCSLLEEVGLEIRFGLGYHL